MRNKKFMKRLCDSMNSMARKEKFVKGLRDSRDLRRERNILRKRLLHRQRLCESLTPTLRGFPIERPEATGSCDLNPTLRGFPTKKA
jgi:hypothetical protein